MLNVIHIVPIIMAHLLPDQRDVQYSATGSQEAHAHMYKCPQLLVTFAGDQLVALLQELHSKSKSCSILRAIAQRSGCTLQNNNLAKWEISCCLLHLEAPPSHLSGNSWPDRSSQF